MNLDEAIEKLKNLSPDEQKRVIHTIETETRQKSDKPFKWIGILLDNAVNLERSDLSEKPSVFAGRAER